jgi:hypothetical protein
MNRGWLARIALVVGLMAAGGAAMAEELNDKMVNWLMNYAAAGMLPKYTTQEGKVVTIDRTKPDEFLIPVEDARQVVKVAYNTARAQICHMKDEEIANSEALVKHAIVSKKWTDKQLLYIRQLQLFVVQITVGSVTIKQVDEKSQTLQVLPTPDNLKKPRPCDDAEAQKLASTIDAYVKEVTP